MNEVYETIKFAVSHGRLTFKRKADVVARSINATILDFEFLTTDWDDVCATVIFKRDAQTYRESLVNTTQCTIPEAFIAQPGTLQICVFGASANIRLVTNSLKLKIIDGGFIPLDSDLPEFPENNEVVVVDAGDINSDIPELPGNNNVLMDAGNIN